jgi:hypothetical protein
MVRGSSPSIALANSHLPQISEDQLTMDAGESAADIRPAWNTPEEEQSPPPMNP